MYINMMYNFIDINNSVVDILDNQMGPITSHKS